MHIYIHMCIHARICVYICTYIHIMCNGNGMSIELYIELCIELYIELCMQLYIQLYMSSQGGLSGKGLSSHSLATPFL